MKTVKRIGVLTGGGDVPGLNSLIKSVVYGCTESGSACEVVGIRRGWEGLTHAKIDRGRDAQYIIPLNRQNARTIDRSGGTILHTSRTNPAKMPVESIPRHLVGSLGRYQEVGRNSFDLTPVVLENVEKLRLDSLIAIGGDDTLSFASRLDREGVPVLAIPKTMDNDVRNTEYCIGFSTAMSRAVEIINRLRSTIGSHERVGVLRMFGRDSGFTALHAAYVTSVRCIIPEYVFEFEKLAARLAKDRVENASGYAILLLSEGATWRGRSVAELGRRDAFGHGKKPNVAEAFADRFEKETGLETLVADLTYELRSGEPDFFDRLVSISFATMACQSIFDNASGRMIAIQNGCYTDTELPDPSLGPRTVDVETMYNRDRFRPEYTSKKGLPILMLPVEASLKGKRDSGILRSHDNGSDDASTYRPQKTG